MASAGSWLLLKSLQLPSSSRCSPAMKSQLAIKFPEEMTMNPLTKIARERATPEPKAQNYLIAIICGLVLGAMLGVSV